MEKILKETYVHPKVELSESEYNHLVDLARMKAKKIEERARQYYEKEGVAKIQFEGRIISVRNGSREIERYEFDVLPSHIYVEPTGEYEKTLFFIPREQREKITKKVKTYLDEVFVAQFGERLFHINEIMKVKARHEYLLRRFIIWTIAGWCSAILMLIAILLK